MRFDDITTLNSNAEQQALYYDQVIASLEHKIGLLKTAKRAMLSLASVEPHESDPRIDMKPFALPAAAKPKTADQVRQDYSRNGGQQPASTGEQPASTGEQPADPQAGSGLDDLEKQIGAVMAERKAAA